MSTALDFLPGTDIAVQVTVAIALHGLALLIAGSLALVVGSSASHELGATGPKWRWFGWFAVLKGLAVIGSQATGAACTDAPGPVFTAVFLAFSLPAWLAGAQFAWASLPTLPGWATPRIPTLIWCGAVSIAALVGGWPGLDALHAGLAGLIGVVMMATLIGEIRALERRGRARAAISLLLAMAGLGGLVGLELMGARYHERLAGWTLNTLDFFVRREFGLVFTATLCAVTLATGWWLWMRLHVRRLATRDWLQRALWLIPAGLLAMAAAGFGLLNYIKTRGGDRADQLFQLRAHTAVVGLELAGWRDKDDPAGFQHALRALAEASPDIDAVVFARSEGDRLRTLVSSDPQVPLPEHPYLWRQAGAPDQRFAGSREPFASSFMRDGHGTFALYCEPWPRPGEGWLIFRVGFAPWGDTMGPVLVQATFIILLVCLAGVAVVVFLIQRELGSEIRLDLVRASAASEAKTELLTRASHELRTPIQSVLGYAELLGRSELEARQGEWLQALRTQGGHLLCLVNDLLDFGALQNGRLTLSDATLSPTRTAREALAAVRPQAEARSLACGLAIESDTPAWVRGDATRLRQILVNLLGNAVKFTLTGGVSLQVSAPEAPRPDGRRRLCFIVTDTGPGIEADDLPDLFDLRGRRRRQPSEGVGLGLALAKRLCRAMGGDLTVESEPGRGSTFTASVVLMPAEAPVALKSTTARRLPELGLRVLVVEDNTALRLLLAAWLDELDCSTTLAEDGERALETARAERFDAVILDLGLPGIDGREVARRLRAAPPRRGVRPPWIVGLSAHASDADRTSALAAGMDVFLSKPVDLETLAAALRQPVAPDPTRQPGLLSSRLLSKEQAEAVRSAALQETPARLDHLRVALEAGDWPRVAATAHYLNNTADVLGATELGVACKRCEDAARAGDTARATRAANSVLELATTTLGPADRR